MTDDPDNVVSLKPAKPGRNKHTRAKGIDYGPKNGAGWGGPAKGEGNRGPGPGRMPEGPERQKKIADKEAAADEALAELHAIGMDQAKPDGVRVMALNSVLDRIEGKAIQRVIAGTTDTVEEIRTADPIEASKAYQRLIK